MTTSQQPSVLPASVSGEPGFYLFAAFLAAEPPDAGLSAAIGAVEQAEAARADIRAQLPLLIARRTEAGDTGDGAAFSDAAALLDGLPRRVAEAERWRVAANIAFLHQITNFAMASVKPFRDEQRQAQEVIATARIRASFFDLPDREKRERAALGLDVQKIDVAFSSTWNAAIEAAGNRALVQAEQEIQECQTRS